MSLSKRLREFYLEEIDAWRRGDRQSPGLSVMGERYALIMREKIKEYENKILALAESTDNPED